MLLNNIIVVFVDPSMAGNQALGRWKIFYPKVKFNLG